MSDADATRVAVLGVGLIGGSIGIAARERLGAEVVAFDPDPATRDEALGVGAADRGDDPALGRADVGDHGVGAGGGEGGGAEVREPADGSRAEDDRGALAGDRHGLRDRVGDPARERRLAGRRVGVEAHHLGTEALAGSQPDRPADQPDAEDGDPRRH